MAETCLTGSSGCAWSSILIVGQARVVLSANAEDDVFELQTIWGGEVALRHQLGELVEIGCRSVGHLLCGQSCD